MNGTSLNKGARHRSARVEVLCLETQGRAILAEIVHEEITEAMRLRFSGKDSSETGSVGEGRRNVSRQNG